MLFKYPYVLYSLLVLLIPILIHLFKLRKFQQTAFTNVLFLEKIKIQSRKSARLKKWLVLLSRLAIFTFLIFAFAFPYFPAKSTLNAPEKYIIYLDNSFSMQASGPNGPLLEKAVQDIITKIDKNTTFSLFTNTETFIDVQLSEIQNELLDLSYVEEQLSPDQVSLKFKNLTKDTNNTAFLVISDFQERPGFDYERLQTNASHIIQLKPQNRNNASVDSLWVNLVNEQKILHIKTSCSYGAKNVNLSIKNSDKLIGKVSLDFSTDKEIITEVPLQNNISIQGLVSIENTEGLQYDNQRFFSINETKKPNILVIGDTFFNFLQKIYNTKEFNFFTTKTNSANSKPFNSFDLIVLNENELLSQELAQKLVAFTKEGGTLCIIPSTKSIENLKSFIKENYNITIENDTSPEKKITQINFQHGLFNGVFTKEVLNFQYPTVNDSYLLDSKNWILQFEDTNPFLIQKENVFVFSSSLNDENTNFKKSPLIVPLFYNMAKQNNSSGKINYIIGEKNEININTSINQDDVLYMKNDTQEFIPLQQVFKSRVKITTNELPSKSGNYQLLSGKEPIYNVSFNYGTNESKLVYANLEGIPANKYSNSILDYFNNSKADFETTDLWKWFLIFALFFLLTEITLLKYL